MLKKIFLLILASGIFYLVSNSVVSAQGQLYCYINSFNSCVIDEYYTNNPDCEPGYKVPDCSPDCCQQQMSGSTGCNNVACIPADSTPTPKLTPTPTPDPGTICGQNGGICRPDLGKDSCAWNEISAPGLNCTDDKPVCCKPVDYIATCPPAGTSGATCKTTCGMSECEYAPVNVCHEFGEQCCLGGSGLALCPKKTTPVFCTSFQIPSYFVNEIDTPYIYTAFGCIAYEIKTFISNYTNWSLGISGVFTLLVIVAGAVLMITGGHDPKKIQAGQELITAALAGTAIIVFSVLLINYLGATVLNLGPIGFLQP